MDIRWVKIIAFHAVKSETYYDGQICRTHCGRVSRNEIVDDLPAERSCESCLRIVARLADKP